MVDWQDPATVFNDLGASVLSSFILLFVLLIRYRHWQVL